MIGYVTYVDADWSCEEEAIGATGVVGTAATVIVTGTMACDGTPMATEPGDGSTATADAGTTECSVAAEL